MNLIDRYQERILQQVQTVTTTQHDVCAAVG